ncbi:origin recognition complex subunit 6-like [Sycon ciliatum]|uniref:origin recognition complex subunit 6-like n=1 Tax=Sycon ciliatum TaxID=27933 RepID=UPI0020ADA0B7|eukprot:scpid60355/ scgid29736/ Origin recognition complex subunit 6
MDWINIFRRIGVSNPTRELGDVAQEYQRRLELRRSSISAITLNASAKMLICAELACKACKQPYNPASVVRLSGESKKNFNRAQQTLEKMIMGQRAGCSVTEVAIRLGCSDVAPMAEAVLERYRSSLAQTVAGASRDSIDLTSPAFVGSAIAVVCKLLKFKVDKRKLREETRCTSTELDKRCEALMAIAGPVVAEGHRAKQTKRPHGYAFLDSVDDSSAADQPSKRSRAQGEGDDDGFGSTGVPFFCYQPLPDFPSWRSRIISSANQALAV